MSSADRERWEKTYGASIATAAELAARPTIEWLEAPRPSANIALDLACGRGRHSGALRRFGYRVVAADISRVALRSIARERGSPRLVPPPSLVQIDTDAWPFAAAAFDLVIQIDFLDRHLFTTLRAAVKPGGSLLLDTFAGPADANTSGPRRSDFRLEYGELRERFGDWEVVREYEAPPPQGRSAILVRRPVASDSIR